MTDYRKGSMAEAEHKSLMKAKVVMAIVTLLLLLMNNFGLFDTYLSFWHQRASGFAKTTGTGLYIGCFLTLLLEGWISDKATNETLWYIIWIILLLAAIATSCGFNFSL